MIRHICMFKLKDNSQEVIDDIIKHAETLKNIEYIQQFQVVLNDKRASSSNNEISLIFDFESIDTLNLYQVHELHVAFSQYITPLRETRACIDYEL